jgi:hypothetical protein
MVVEKINNPGFAALRFLNWKYYSWSILTTMLEIGLEVKTLLTPLMTGLSD